MFMLSFFEIPKGCSKRLISLYQGFFWQNDSQKKKYKLTKWSIVYQPKDQGGLDIQNLENQNQRY
jgi:hypothetical protein